MLSVQDVSLSLREDPNAARHRFESFKLGKGLPSTMAHKQPNHSHTRSHSRNASFSTSLSSLTLASTPCTSNNDLSSLPSNSNSMSKRPNSHHRRRSSVSTRCESAELMGVTVPDLPASTSDDNINLGEKDSIRRRALWALEGKPDLSYSKVEIPEFPTLETDTKTFDFPTKPSFPPGPGTGFSGGLMSKRDSFKLLTSSSSSKDQLHTLVEEEEEEEEENIEVVASPIEDSEPTTPTSAHIAAVTKPTPPRPRPASLNLRPLSLTLDNIAGSTHGLPTPTLTPGARPSGLRPLSLTQGIQNSPQSGNIDSPAPTVTPITNKRQSLIFSPPSTPPLRNISRRPSMNVFCESPSPVCLDDTKPKRQSSISYRSSAAELPTPEITPTNEPSFSISSSSTDDEPTISRPLSASEQHFLFKSHNALLARITDLEHALSSRPRSRPDSTNSDASSDAAYEPTDEMLQLLADLKAERDELKRDVDGWRTRVADLDKQVGIFAKRVELERRDAWVARSRVVLLEVEKGALEKALAEKTDIAQGALRNRDVLEDKCSRLEEMLKNLVGQVQAGRNAKQECVRLQSELSEERMRREELERTLDKANLLATPVPRASAVNSMIIRARKQGLGFTSVDSESSATDVESLDDSFSPSGFGLKAVIEEEEEDGDTYEKDNGLAGYEDEEDSDQSFGSPGGSSAGSIEEFSHPVSRYGQTPSPALTSGTISRSNTPSPSLVPANEHPSHVSRASLSQMWTFPRSQPPAMLERKPTEVDHFFGCLDDLDDSPTLDSLTSYESSKGLFSMGFGADDDDELPPFVIPSHVGVEVEVPSALDAVPEEDENEDKEESIFGQELGGITITFTPPEPENSSLVDSKASEVLPKRVSDPAPFFEPFDEEDSHTDISFNFGRPTSPVADSPKPSTEARSTVIAQSSIPRAPRFTPTDNSVSSNRTNSTPVRSSTPTNNATTAFATPPSKRSGTMPSFIPQPVASPIRKATPPKPKVFSTFIPQPQRKPASPVVFSSKTTNATVPMNVPRRSADVPAPASSHSSSEMNDVPLSESIHECQAFSSPISSFSSIMSSPIAARLSTFTSYIPLSWTSRASQVEPAPCFSPPTPGGLTSGSNVTDKPAVIPVVTEKPLPTRQTTAENAERKYVTKEKQLEKLRSRLGQNMVGRGVVDVCKTCKDEPLSF